MKRLILLLALSIATLSLHAQVIRSGVVHRTAHTIERAKPQLATPYEAEIGRWTQSAGAELGFDFGGEGVVGGRYNIAFRPIAPVVVNFSGFAGYRTTDDIEFDIIVRPTVQFYPLTYIKPTSRVQPFVGEGFGMSIPYLISDADHLFDHGTTITSVVGVDIYGPYLNSTLAVEFSYTLDEYPYLVATYAVKF